MILRVAHAPVHPTHTHPTHAHTTRDDHARAPPPAAHFCSRTSRPAGSLQSMLCLRRGPEPPQSPAATCDVNVGRVCGWGGRGGDGASPPPQPPRRRHPGLTRSWGAGRGRLCRRQHTPPAPPPGDTGWCAPRLRSDGGGCVCAVSVHACVRWWGTRAGVHVCMHSLRAPPAPPPDSCARPPAARPPTRPPAAPPRRSRPLIVSPSHRSRGRSKNADTTSSGMEGRK